MAEEGNKVRLNYDNITKVGFYLPLTREGSEVIIEIAASPFLVSLVR